MKYTDVFSVQADHREKWEPSNLGFTLSRYFIVHGLDERYFLFPGVGVRAKVGQHSRVEVFPKIAWAGILGASSGVHLDDSGFGVGASIWAGIEFLGAEYSYYAGENGGEKEYSIYLAFQFGANRNGKYGFENWLWR